MVANGNFDNCNTLKLYLAKNNVPYDSQNLYMHCSASKIP